MLAEMGPVSSFLKFCTLALSIKSIYGSLESYTGSQVYKVYMDSKGIVDNLLKDEDLDIWSRNHSHVDVMVPASKIPTIKLKLLQNRISHETLLSDVEEAIENENLTLTEGYRMAWQTYHSLNDIYEYLDELANEYPKFVSVGVLGYTVENRQIKFIKISSGMPKSKAVFLDGGIHAREWVSSASMTFIVRELVMNRSNVTKELRDLDFYIVPVVNPDGYLYSHTKDRMWRKNRSVHTSCAGVDLNRNFDDHFGGKGSSSNPCHGDFHGDYAASENETKALQNFLISIREDLKAYISFHSYGQLIMTPFGYDYNSFSDNHAQLQKVGEEAARAIQRAGGPAYDVGNIAHIIYPAAGGSIDWVKTNLRVPFTYAVELRDTGRYGFLLPAKFIIPTAIDAWETVKVVAAAASKV